MSLGWSEEEVRAAVEAYFNALQAEQEERPVNKRQIYRQLSARYPKRSAKAFELKFQNISAILYEQKLPYCSGLKPRFNYQRLLKLVVLDHVDRTPLPALEPHEILFSKLREIRNRGPLLVTKEGAGRFGLAVEEALGIAQNSSKDADFMGIELKTKSDKSLQTLFSLVPSRYVQDANKAAMFERNCYVDAKRNRRALYTSFSTKPDTLGFRLVAEGQVVKVVRNSVTVLEYDAEDIEKALLSKHSQTAFLLLTRSREGSREHCTLEALQLCKWPSVIRFLRLVQLGDIYLDFTMSTKEGGGYKDHGCLWRIPSASLDRLYLSQQMLDLSKSLPSLIPPKKKARKPAAAKDS